MLTQLHLLHTSFSQYCERFSHDPPANNMYVFYQWIVAWCIRKVKQIHHYMCIYIYMYIYTIWYIYYAHTYIYILHMMFLGIFASFPTFFPLKTQGSQPGDALKQQRVIHNDVARSRGTARAAETRRNGFDRNFLEILIGILDFLDLFNGLYEDVLDFRWLIRSVLQRKKEIW
jgi:hypothetical protein